MSDFDKWFNRVAIAHPCKVASVAVVLEGGALFAMLPQQYWGWWFLLPVVFTWLILVWVLKLAKENIRD